MKTVLITLSILASFSTFAETVEVITKPIVENAETAGSARKEFDTQEDCVAYGKKAQKDLKAAGYKIFENRCDKWDIGFSTARPQYMNLIKFF